MDSYKAEFSEFELRNIQSEFKRIKEGEHYLDHAGTTLYSENQIKTVYDNLSKSVYCNPHTCKDTEDLIDQVRYRVLKHFNTNSSKYSVIFTSGATSSLKLIAECFNFQRKNTLTEDSGLFVYTKENHTSVLGMREIVKTKKISCINQDDLISQCLSDNINQYEQSNTNSLLVFSAQCNYSGYKIPLKIIDNIHKNGLEIENKRSATKWFVCLDAASYVATNFLNLSEVSPDFVCLSFYKMFGYPTGIGALLVLKESEYVLDKSYFGGGTVKIAMSEVNWHRKKDKLQQRFEDGSLPFLSIISLLSGIDTIYRLIPPTEKLNSMERISLHVFGLAKYLYSKLKELKYQNGNPVVKLYSHNQYESVHDQGGIVNFNILNDNGSYVGFVEVGHFANIHNIYIRTGCFCNIGACQTYMNLSNEDVRNHYKVGRTCGDDNDLVDGIPTGSVRVSIGYMTNMNNINALIDMIRHCYINNNNIKTLKPHIPLRQQKKSFDKIKLHNICVYPIKSCGAMKIYDKWPISSKGLLYDRQWTIVDDTGLVVTQKKETKLCLITPTIDLNNNQLTLTYPGKNSISIPLDVKTCSDIAQNIKICHSKVCGDEIEGNDCGDDVSVWLSDALDFPGLRLIKQRNDNNRISKQTKSQISLTNQAQYLLINSASVHWLAEKVDDWVVNGVFPENNLEGVIDRFRGNLIIETANPLEEINWKTFKIGTLKFRVDGQCTRCQMICIDQNNGIKTSEPLRTISKEFQGKMKFGLYLTLDHYESNFTDMEISCKDTIEIEYVSKEKN